MGRRGYPADLVGPGDVTNAHLTGDTADIDDLALSSIIIESEASGLEPISADRLRGEEQALQIKIEHGVPIRFGDLR